MTNNNDIIINFIEKRIQSMILEAIDNDELNTMNKLIQLQRELWAKKDELMYAQLHELFPDRF